jgi:Tfp pilus assembly protein PilO
MNTVREYRMPLLIAGGAFVIALILWVALISPQNSKLAGLQAQSIQLQSQETALQARLTALQSEGQKLSSNCADLQKISTQIPSVRSPTDIDAAESSFESQFNTLAGTSGVTLAQFSGFAPANTSGTGAAATQPAVGGASTSPAGVTAVPTTLTVQGNYGQMTSFANGLDSFPRLFVIQKFVLAYGPATTSAAGSTSGATGAQAAGGTASSGASVTGTPLWVGGRATSATAGPYSLQITGSIYYTSTPNALSACSKAAAAQSTTK